MKQVHKISFIESRFGYVLVSLQWTYRSSYAKEFHLIENGTEIWRHNGKMHRLSAPANVRTDGTSVWYKNGNLSNEISIFNLCEFF